MPKTWCVACALAVVICVSACSSSRKSSLPTTTTTSARPKAQLEFRPVAYRGATPLVFPGRSRQCAKGRPLPPKDVLLTDRDNRFCFVLGPVRLTGANVTSATPVYDPGASQWAVQVGWANDDFLTKIAQPLVNRMIAIVLDGVVQSAPTVNPGIVGREVMIDGAGYSRADAIRVAAAITRIAPSQVHVKTNG